MKNKMFIMIVAISILSFVPNNIGYASECNTENPCGTWAMLDPQGTVTNIIVCQVSVCGGGTFAGQTVVPQIAPNPVTNDTTSTGGYWGTYDNNSKEFTIGDNNGIQKNLETIIKNDIDSNTQSTITIETTTSSVAKTFKYEDTILSHNDFNENGQIINSWEQKGLKNKELPNDSPANIQLTKAYIEDELEKFKSESMTLAQRMTEGELTDAAKAENKTLIIENIMSVVRLLNSWIKNVITK